MPKKLSGDILEKFYELQNYLLDHNDDMANILEEIKEFLETE